MERQLQTRRDPETLQSHGILPRKFLVIFQNLKITSAPNKPSHYYMEARHLERARAEDFLNKRLAQRPDKKTLIGVSFHFLSSFDKLEIQFLRLFSDRKRFL